VAFLYTAPAHERVLTDSYHTHNRVLVLVRSLTIWEGYHGTETGLMWTGEGTRAPGNLDFDVLNLLKGKSDADKANMATKEIKNGRAAMLGIMSMAM
jgi:Chlorophyll A-B binding protein